MHILKELYKPLPIKTFFFNFTQIIFMFYVHIPCMHISVPYVMYMCMVCIVLHFYLLVSILSFELTKSNTFAEMALFSSTPNFPIEQREAVAHGWLFPSKIIIWSGFTCTVTYCPQEMVMIKLK